MIDDSFSQKDSRFVSFRETPLQVMSRSIQRTRTRMKQYRFTIFHINDHPMNKHNGHSHVQDKYGDHKKETRH